MTKSPTAFPASPDQPARSPAMSPAASPAAPPTSPPAAREEDTTGRDLTNEVLAGCPPLERLLEVLGELDRLNAAAVGLVDRLQASGEAEALTGLPLEMWLSVRGRQVRSDRQMLGATADVLRWLPSLRGAFRRGEVAWGQVRAVVLVVVKLPAQLHDAIDAELAATIPALRDAEPDALVHAVRRATDHAAPTPADGDEAGAVRDRYLALQPRLDGSGGTIHGDFDPTGFAVLDAWFATGPPPACRTRDHLGEEPDPARQRTGARRLGRRRADQLVEHLARDLAGDPTDVPAGPHSGSDAGNEAAGSTQPDEVDGPTGRARPRPTLLLRLPYSSLLGGEIPGDLLTTLTGGRLRLSARASRELVDRGGADLRAIVVDELGEVVGVGRRTRVPPGWLRDALLARDAICSAPGCRVAARRCHLDHGQRWQDDGRTDIANLSPLCATDNHARERDGWTAVGDVDGTRRWEHRRTGLSVRHVPDTWRPPPYDRRGGRPADPARGPTGRTGPSPPSDTDPPPGQRGRDPAVAPPPADPPVPF